MRKLILLFAAVAMLAAAGAAVAKTVTVSITKAGYAPGSVSIVQGDTVQFVNSDSVAHQVAFKSASGVRCTSNPFLLGAGATGSCVFQSAGSYSYSDPTGKGKSFRGTVDVTAAAEALTLSATPLLLVYGSHTTLSGTDALLKAGDKVDVMAQQCGAAAGSKFTTIQATAGAYSTTANALMNTAYTTKVKNTASNVVTVRVRPMLQLTRVAAHRYSVRVSATQTFAGKYASFQRYNGTLHRWVAVKAVPLRANASGVAPTIVTSATFRSTLKSKLRIRMTLGQAQVGGCYAAGVSNTTIS